MTMVISFVTLLLFHMSFRFFFWLVCVEVLTMKIILFSAWYNGSSVYLCSLLVMGACEVGTALSLMVTLSRFSGLEKTKKMTCENF